MGRRSDHTRAELENLFIAEGHRHLADVGLARFSAREVAKRVGYSVGTLYNVFGTYDGLMLAINARTLKQWTEQLRQQLEVAGEDRIATLVRGYFAFAEQNPKTWTAIYEHHMADGGAAPEWYQTAAETLMTIVVTEIAAVIPQTPLPAIISLARSLVATVHGHCAFSLYLTFSMLGETAPIEAALARVREAIAAQTTRVGES